MDSRHSSSQAQKADWAWALLLFVTHPLAMHVAHWPPPWDAARVSGFFAARAGLPGISDAPRVRVVQRQQLATALPWVARALDLPPPGTGQYV